MKEFFTRNVGNLITIILLIISLSIAYGVVKTNVAYNTQHIESNAAQIERIRTWANKTDVQYTEIRVKLQNIEALLLEMREKE